MQVPGNLNPPALKKLVHTIYPLNSGGLLDLIPSTLDLMYVALGQTSARTDPFEERFRKFIDECRKTYDVVIIDCHPAGSILTRTALRNSDHVLIPVTPTPFAARGVSLMLQFIASGQAGARGAVPHILFNSEGKHPSDSQLNIRGNPRFAKYCLSETLRRRTAFSVPVGGENLVWFSHKPHSTNAFINLSDVVTEVVDRLNC